MHTHNPLVTPVFKGISVEAKYREHKRRSNRFYHLLQFRNGRVIRPSLPCIHEDFARLSELRPAVVVNQPFSRSKSASTSRSFSAERLLTNPSAK